MKKVESLQGLNLHADILEMLQPIFGELSEGVIESFL